ncbi:crotonyl-CoA carboxylase/reductase [Streptomyces sp. NPDC012461]|uniref:Crotonyl-CoA carboxylase/reductase n=3 Tax=unclassified Streptomyces TaxID=2593676 RepID=A0A6G3QZK6_9ACTN|nr:MULTISPECIES: crotonyl-CoA carboxylase/reductase [unclassified Streptomyces]NEA88617.1 crotonyl-CoA carboxylase/reductase [Streptomyces sp. SID14436]NEC79905.1 crotonyl-CoA carboxylase/reductase [Streptomyces sp. SID7958]NED16578.1 crotonyl-CoA carboxylase/reductase [Streptomyces sp. SID9913]
MDLLSKAVLNGAPPEELERIPLPEEFLAGHLRADDAAVMAGESDKDVRRTLHVGHVAMPEPAPDEVVVAVMASSINFNTVWSAMFEPISTFTALRRFARQGGWTTRHDLPHQVVGSDAAGVVVRVGTGVRHWRTGDHVVVSPAYVDDQDPGSHDDGMMGRHVRAWGYETNFGGLAHYTVVRATQLVAKPPHLTWEEAASVTLCAGTAYRMLVGEHGARMKQGDVVLVWGATGGLGAYAVQMVRNGGGIAVGVVGSPEKADFLRRQGCDVVIDRREIGLDTDGDTDPAELGRRLGRAIRAEVGEDPHIAFDYVGRSTFGLSVHVVRRGGTVVTCGSSTGYEHRYDNRYLWMNLKRVVGSHIANLQEQTECLRLFEQGRLVPVLSTVYPLEQVADAARLVQENRHLGKVGVRCLAPEDGLGVTDPALRARIGEERLTAWRRPAPAPAPAGAAR